MLTYVPNTALSTSQKFSLILTILKGIYSHCIERESTAQVG